MPTPFLPLMTTAYHNLYPSTFLQALPSPQPPSPPSLRRPPKGKSIIAPRIATATVMVASKMLKNGFLPRKGLSVDLQGIVQPVYLPKNLDTLGLGFKPTAADERWARKMKKMEWVLPKPISHLSRSFVRPGIKKHLFSKVTGSLIGADGDLDIGFEKVFAEVNMVEAREGSGKANVQFVGPRVKFNNWESW